MQTWTRFSVQAITLAIVQRAFAIKDKRGFSYWDIAIIAAALSAGCTILYSEDMQHGAMIENLRIHNPFV